MAAEKKYRHGGDHVIDLDDGRMVEPGEIISLTGEEAGSPTTAVYIEEGTLFELEEKKDKTMKEGGDS